MARLYSRDSRSRAIRNPIYASALSCGRYEIEAELFADDAREEAADRMLLPPRCMRHRADGRPAWRSQHRNDPGLLAFGASCLLR